MKEKLLHKLYQGFPHSKLSEPSLLESNLSMDDINYLHKNGFLTKEKINGMNYYRIGPNGVTLISVRKSEEMTNLIIVLTSWSILIGLIQMWRAFTVIPLYAAVITSVIILSILLTLYYKLFKQQTL
jgi:hypothetical protein